MISDPIAPSGSPDSGCDTRADWPLANQPFSVPVTSVLISDRVDPTSP